MSTIDATPPWRLNLALAALLAAMNLVQFIALPLWLLPASPLWGLVLVPVVLSATPLWSLLHEAIHGILHPAAAVNDGVGRGLAVLFGAPFRVLRLGHLMHHRFNRTDLDRTEVYDGASAHRLKTQAAYFARLLGGLYLAELASSAAALLPRPLVTRVVAVAFGREGSDGRSMRRAAERQLLAPGAIRELRIDGLGVLALLGLAFWLYGGAWWMLALALLGRAVLISFHDNAYHYGTPLDDVLYSYNLRLPGPLAALMLNFNYHAVHHRHPALPWSALSQTFRDSEGTFEGNLISVGLRQLRGPVPAARLPGPKCPPTRQRAPSPFRSTR
jgi:fatty acid desaturase